MEDLQFKRAYISEAYSADIGVGIFRIYPMVLHYVQEGICHEATIAAPVSISNRAVHQVLRTEGLQDTCSLLELALQSSNCTEGPARAARTL